MPEDPCRLLSYIGRSVHMHESRTLKVMVIEKGSPWLTLYLKSSRFLYVVSHRVHLFFFF